MHSACCADKYLHDKQGYHFSMKSVSRRKSTPSTTVIFLFSINDECPCLLGTDRCISEAWYVIDPDTALDLFSVITIQVISLGSNPIARFHNSL